MAAAGAAPLDPGKPYARGRPCPPDRMPLEFTPWALLGLASGAFSWTMAAVVYRTRPERTQNRLLALFLALAGSTWLMLAGLVPLLTDPVAVYALLVTAFATHIGSHYVHLRFQSTLPSPLAAPLRRRGVRLALGLGFAAWLGHVVLFPGQWMAGLVPATLVVPWSFQPTEAYLQFRWVFTALWWFGVAVSVTAYRNRAAWRDPAQARAYLAAFVVHDGGFGLGLGLLQLFQPADPGLAGLLLAYPWPVLNLWLTVLLAYGILRTQLFDIDLHVHRTVQASTLAAAFVAVFFVASEAAQGFFQSSLGPVVGLVAAGALVFVLAPLQRAAERVASAAVPQASASPEYLSFRKMQVYQAALDEVLADGVLTEKDRRVLRALRGRLGIGEEAARDLERDALATRAAG